MAINFLSAGDSNYILEQLLNSKTLSPSSKQTLARAGSDDKDVLDAAKKVLSDSGQSLDAFDTDKSGDLSGSERDALISALVQLLSNPDTAETFLKSLHSQNAPSSAVASTPSAGSSGQTPPAASSASTPVRNSDQATSQDTGGTRSAGSSGACAVGGATQASEFGSDKKVDPSKNFDTVPGGTYSVKDCEKDIMKMAASDQKEKGPPPTQAQAHQLAQGIINGVNNYFDKSTNPKATAQTLIASAWKESKFNFNAQNGGVFQCAPNRFEDWQKAHPGSSMTDAQMSTTGNPAASIDVALWAMAHPVAGMGAPAGVSTAVPAAGSAEKALYFWNYNNRQLGDGSGNTELDDYMQKTKYFKGLVS